MIKVFCDDCGLECQDWYYRLHFSVETAGVDIMTLDTSDERTNWLLCMKCARTIQEALCWTK